MLFLHNVFLLNFIQCLPMSTFYHHIIIYKNRFLKNKIIKHNKVYDLYNSQFI